MKESHALGQQAEQRALAYFLNRNNRLLEKNYRFRKAEVDMIFQKDNFLVVVEVKARSSHYFGEAETFVSPKKIQLLVMAMDHYIQKHELDVEVRFDIMVYHVEGKHWNQKHLKDAFYFFNKMF